MWQMHPVSARCSCARCVSLVASWDVQSFQKEERMEQGKKAVPTSAYEKAPDLKEYSYFIWSPESHLAPKIVFDSKDKAIRVAYGMANRNPESRFCVCKIEGVAKTTKVSFDDYGK